VVDYGGRSELTLLAALDTATGRDLPLEDIGLPVVRRHHGFRDFQTIKALGESAEYRGQEGFVIRWESGLRAKVKFADYVRLHKLIFGCSNLTIWEALRAGEGLDAILERVPDELYGWVRKTERELAESFAATDRLIRAEYGRVIERLGANAERKAYAEEFRRSKYSGFLFSLLDGKDYRDRLWKEIRPREFLPFKTDGEDL
jgi:RNA ligase